MDKLVTDKMATLQFSLKLMNPKDAFRYKIVYTREYANTTKPQYHMLAYDSLMNTDQWITVKKENVLLKNSVGFKTVYLKVEGPSAIDFDGPPPDYIFDNVILDIQ